MTGLYEIRDEIILLYRKYENTIRPAYRFLIVLLTLVYINKMIGYQELLTSAPATILIALICTLLPAGAIVAVLSLVIIANLYSLALEAAVVGAALFLVLLLVYFRFAPTDSMLLVASPACYMLGIPYFLPLAGGLIYNTGSAATVSLAAVVTGYINFVSANDTAIGALAKDDLIARFRFMIDGILQNKEMMIAVLAGAASTLAVYFVRRLKIKYAWNIAAGVGALIQLVILLAGDMKYSTNISIGKTFIGVIGALIIAELIAFFLFNLDYSRIEDVQFEDDNYYYYVKAVPKISFARPKHTVKNINTSRSSAAKRRIEEAPAKQMYQPEPEDEDVYEDNVDNIDNIDNIDNGDSYRQDDIFYN